MADSWHNQCGGVPYRNHGDGTIEIEGMGVVMPPPGEGPWTLRRYVRNSWRNFEPEIRAAAAKHGVPVSWVLAIIATETGIASETRERQSGSDRGQCCLGPMQVMVRPYPNYRTYGGYSSPSDMLDPWKNIDTGTAIMRHHMDDGLDLPAISAKYNSGSLCCPLSPTVASSPGKRQLNEFLMCSASISGTSYPLMTTMMNNFAIVEMGVSNRSWLPWVGAGLAVGGVLAAWLYMREPIRP